MRTWKGIKKTTLWRQPERTLKYEVGTELKEMNAEMELI